MEYMVYYDKKKKRFLIARESKALADESGVDLAIIKLAKEKVVDTTDLVVGPAEFIKSKRGGGKGNPSSFKRGEVY